MNAFRKQVEDYLKQWPDNKAVISYDFANDEIHYGSRRDSRSIKSQEKILIELIIKN